MKKHIFYIISILLIVWSCANSREQAIPIITDFDAIVVNNDFSVPVEVRIINRTEGAESYNWSFEGGMPSSSTNRNPGTITYTAAGNYTVFLEATNQDGSIDTMEVTIPINAEIITGFTLEVIENNYPPVEVVINNTTSGGTSYNWIFEGGLPEASTDQNPSTIVYTTPGEHTITLEVTNGLETHQVTETITVLPDLVTDFNYEVSFDDSDFQVPVTLQMLNNSMSATDYLWTFQGGNPAISTEENPIVVFDTPGTYNLTLEATNGKVTREVTKEITVFENTNLRVFENIELGINTAHTNNTRGAFFSTLTGEVYTSEAVNEENGALIDIVFFGLNEQFTFNKFISPNEAQSLTFNAIPNAISSRIVNKQETCMCMASLTETGFDAIVNDASLEALTLPTITEEIPDFDNTTLPRIVLFETIDGRKGAVKIKEFIADGINSYINVDIKVQKE